MPQLLVHFIHAHVLQFDRNEEDLIQHSITCGQVKSKLLQSLGLEPSLIQLNLTLNGKYIQDEIEVWNGNYTDEMLILRATVAGGLRGGKGGFGAMLRATAKKAGKRITDFSSCRDLSGRR